MTVSDADTCLVVVPCLNEERTISRVLDVLIDNPGASLIIVADGGSTDATRRIVSGYAARDPRVQLIDNARRIQSAGINRAVELFGYGHRWLVRVDAHCDYPAGYVSGLVQTARAQNCAAVVVPMETRGNGPLQRSIAAAQNSRLGNGGAAHRLVTAGRWVEHGHHALFALAAFRSAGGYCEQMSHNEDAELDVRLARQGGRIWIEPSLAIVYYPRRTLGALFRQYLGYGAGRATTVRRHRLKPRVRQVLPLAVLPAVLALPLAPISPLLAVPAAAWALICLGWGAALAIRQRSAAVLVAGPAAMVMHLGWAAGFWREWLWGARSRSTRWAAALRFGAQ